MKCDKTNSSRCVTLLLIMLFCSTPLLGMIALEQKANENKTMENLKDEDVIAMLSTRNTESAHLAVEQIMRRGDRMIPLLLRFKGNKSFFYGYGLGHHLSSFVIPLPVKGTETNDGSFITVEVAALYLISAIYHKTTEFAEAPYLSDGKPVSWQRFNTPERVGEAWESTQKWIQAFTSEGIEALRSKGYSPLSRSKVRFWAGR